MKKLGSDFPPERYLCPEGLIQANPKMEAIVNPDTNNVHIFHTQAELSIYCDNSCLEKNNCTEKYKKNISEILSSFPSYSK